MRTVQRYEKSRLTVRMDSKFEILAKELRGEINNPVSIAKLAKKIGLSHRQLNRRFKEATGLSPQQFQVRVKIEKTFKLLGDTEKALVEIGLELGFCDQSAFTAQFRKRMSMTPRQYRTQYGRKRASES
jgi:AraC-like DNA-binding protein